MRAVVAGEGERVSHIHVHVPLLIRRRRRRTTKLDLRRCRPAEHSRSHVVINCVVRVVRVGAEHGLQCERLLVDGQEVAIAELAGLQHVLVGVAQRLLGRGAIGLLVHLVLQVRGIPLRVPRGVLQRLHGLDHFLDLYVGYRQFGILLFLIVVRRLLYLGVHFSHESALALKSTEIVIIRFRIDYFLYFPAFI